MSRRTLQPLLVLLTALIVVGAIAVAVAIPPSDDANPSSHSAGRRGSLAMYTWLERLGLPVSRISGSFTLEGADVLVEYDPVVALSAQDVDTVMDHLHSGGDLILAISGDSVSQAAPLIQRLGIVLAGPDDAGTAVPAQPFDVADRVHGVPVGAGVSFLTEPPLVPLLVHGGGVVAGAVQVSGGGRVYVLGDTQPLSNDGLRHDDSAGFLLTLLERARGGHIAFDEFHHDEGGGAGGGAGAIFNGPIGLASVLAALVVVACLAINGRRLGQPVTPDATRVPSASSYVQAMGELFARSRRRGAVAGRYADELKSRIGAATGIDRHAHDAAFVESLRAAGHERAGEVDALLRRARALAASQPEERDLLTLAGEIDALERTWGAVAQPAQWPA